MEVVRAALRRFVIGGPFTVVTAACEHREVAMIGDIRELKGDPPPFIELRFKPPKHDLRLFGRFVGNDDLVLTTPGMKSLAEKTGTQKNYPFQTSARDARPRFGLRDWTSRGSPRISSPAYLTRGFCDGETSATKENERAG